MRKKYIFSYGDFQTVKTIIQSRMNVPLKTLERFGTYYHELTTVKNLRRITSVPVVIKALEYLAKPTIQDVMAPEFVTYINKKKNMINRLYDELQDINKTNQQDAQLKPHVHRLLIEIFTFFHILLTRKHEHRTQTFPNQKETTFKSTSKSKRTSKTRRSQNDRPFSRKDATDTSIGGARNRSESNAINRSEDEESYDGSNSGESRCESE